MSSDDVRSFCLVLHKLVNLRNCSVVRNDRESLVILIKKRL
jgi:hypothetical protein